jgi:NCAIR mutase (PurE)-related protein
MKTSAKRKSKAARPATGKEICSILGPVDDELVMAILETGATHHEVMQAHEWLDDDDYMGNEVGKPMDIRVARVHRVLQRDRERMEPYDR